ncbi:lipid-A-disaccharide synthase [bacterium]|nr:lipid-A-disaccharide synthase [bacterium]
MSQSLFIMAGEASGDLHGAHLARALLAQRPDLRLLGMGGPAMAEAGVDILHDVTAHAAMGITEIAASIRAVHRVYRDMVRRLDSQRPDGVALIDYPEFNLRFARRAHDRGIPVAYYILPQLWAWRTGRVRAVARNVDLPLVILPFERAFYAKHGIDATFIGHPLMDPLAHIRRDRSFAEMLGLPTDRPIIGVLPGSRRKEICALLPHLLGAAERLDTELGGVTVVTAPAPSVPAESYESWSSLTHLPLHVFPGRAHEVMAASDLLLIASGTATLEAGIIGTPMIVTYRVSPLTYRIGRLLIRGIRFFSLVNLVADREVVPELLQSEVTADSIAARALDMFRDGSLERMAAELANEVRPALGPPGASTRAAQAILNDLMD